MKKINPFLTFIALVSLFLVTSCETPVVLTSWKNPATTNQVSKVVVMPLFEKLEYMKPFEQAMVNYFTSRGLKSIGSLDFLNPTIQYPINDIKKKCDSLGADAILLFVYQGTDKSESYVPPTTYYTGYYGGYGGYWGGGYWGGYGAVYTDGGYWTSTSVVHLTAKLYMKGSQEPVWTGELSITDPTYIDKTAYHIGQYIYSDWVTQKLIRTTKK
jgi:hypothetical protein